MSSPIPPGAPTKLCSRNLHVRAAVTTVACMQCAAVDALDDVTALVDAMLPQPQEGTAALVSEAAWTGEQRRRLAGYLRAHPDALASEAVDAPAVVVRLIRGLARAGIPGVVVPVRSRRLCPAGLHERSGWTRPHVSCARCRAETAITDAVGVLTLRVPDLPAETARDLVSTSARSGEAARTLAAHLHAHSDALVSGSSDVPLVVVMLVNAMLDANISGVFRLRCVGCAKPQRHLPMLAAGGRSCFNCHQRANPEPCGGCGKTLPVAAREKTGGAVCGTCRAKDPSTWQPCTRCGLASQVVARVEGQAIGRCCYAPPVIRCTMCGLAKGTKPWKTRRPVCLECQARPRVTCSLCERDAPPPEGDEPAMCAVCRAVPALPCQVCARPTAARDRGGAARCADCYQRPVRPCGRCGRVRAITRLARDGDPELCAICWTGPTVACESCGEVRPCRGERRQRMLCSKCCPVAPQPCAHCGRLKRVTAHWLEGPICHACYGRALAAKGHCPQCGAWRRLLASPDFVEKVCSPCGGGPPQAVCRTCGVEDRLHDRGRCAACALDVRLDAIFGEPGRGGQLEPVRDMLRTLKCPRDVISWLRKSDVTPLLRRFNGAEVTLTYEILDALPRSRAVWFIEHLLSTTGVLAGRDPVLARFELWISDFLEGVDVAHHDRLLRRHATWEVLRPLRAASARRHLSDHAHNSAKTKLKAALAFLEFLAERNHALIECSQADLDAWGAASTASRCQSARPFVAWAIRQRLAPDVTYPSRVNSGGPNVVFDDGEWTLARQLLHGDGIDAHDRVAGLLVVLYAQSVTRISRLTAEDVIITGATVHLRLGTTPLALPPPLAQHVRALLEPRRETTAAMIAGSTHWLFPGRHPGRPVHATALAVRMRGLGVRTSTSRSAAISNLAAKTPAAVIADLLGISVHTAATWADATARARADYSAHKAPPRAPSDSGPGQPEHVRPLR